MPPPTSAAVLCVMFALRRESMYFRRNCGVLERLSSAPCDACLGGGLLLVETGVGRTAVHAAFDWLFAGPHRPARVLYAGFAGALDPALGIGDVLFADEVVDEAGGRWPATWPTPPSLRRGRLLTTSRLIASVDDKQRLGTQYQALAVDMEAAYAAARCAEECVPFGCVRAISDRAQTPLSPALVAMLSQGRVAPHRVAAALVRRPGLIGELWRLGRDTRHAARQLSNALVHLRDPAVEFLD